MSPLCFRKSRLSGKNNKNSHYQIVITGAKSENWYRFTCFTPSSDKQVQKNTVISLTKPRFHRVMQYSLKQMGGGGNTLDHQNMLRLKNMWIFSKEKETASNDNT